MCFIFLSSSSIKETSSLPARQEVTSRARVHGDWFSGAPGLHASVEQRASPLPGDELFHTAGLQTAGVPKLNPPAASSVLCA